MFVDRDIDAVMHRTRHRPLVTGAVTPSAAVVFSVALEVAAFVLFWRAVNLFSALLALGAALFYVFVYSIGLKRRSTQNIVIGGAAGAVPVLVGWTAVTDRLAWPAIVLFAMIVDLDAVALLGAGGEVPGRLQGGERADAAGGRPLRTGGAPDHLVLARARGDLARLRRRRPLRAGSTGRRRRSPARSTWRTLCVCGERGERRRARCALFTYSITYITVVFAAMAVDVIVRYH